MSDGIRLLAIETSGRIGSVALAIDDTVEERRVEEARRQSSRLLPMIDDLLGTAGIRVQALDAIAFGQGPGSFTGLRVAAAVAQGLALASGVPIVSVPSMAGMALGACRREGNASAVVCIDARMDEVYWGHYEIRDGLAAATRADALSLPAEVVGPADRPYICIGDGFDRYREELATVSAGADRIVDDAVPLAGHLVPLGRALAARSAFVEPAAALPVYLRDSTAWRRR